MWRPLPKNIGSSIKNSFLNYNALLLGFLLVFSSCYSEVNEKPVPTEKVAITLPGIFSDHMVLQMNSKVSVWGESEPGREVFVTINGQHASGVVDDAGKWTVSLNNLKPGGPFDMTVQVEATTLTFTDVLIGQVLLGSGQSNMEVSLYKAKHGKHKTWSVDQSTLDFVGDGNYPRIRVSAKTRDNLKTPNGGWLAFSSDIKNQLPATMSCVAISLHKKLKVPVGIIVRAISSSPSGSWVDKDEIKRNVKIQNEIDAYTKELPHLNTMYKAAIAEYNSIQGQTKPKTPALKAYWNALLVWDIINSASPSFKRKKPKQPYSPGLIGTRDIKGGNFKKLIQPIIPYTIGCIVWDQGENGIGVGGVRQITMMKVLVTDWRKRFNNGNIPFVYIRKNNYVKKYEELMNTIPKTYMVDNRGLSQALHPTDKYAYSKRIVRVMLEKIYNK
jgi:sialate O-acetylesterase